MTTIQKTTDVVVVGAGPVGLVAASELARRGVGVRIIDKLTEPTNESRAIAIHGTQPGHVRPDGNPRRPRRDRREVDQHALLSGGQPAGPGQVRRRGQRLPLLAADRTDRNRTRADRPARPTRRHDRSRRGSRRTDAVRAQKPRLGLRHGDGSTETVTTSWVIAADGAHSTVRHMVGTRAPGIVRRASASSSATATPPTTWTPNRCTPSSRPRARSS